ncbi:MAG: GTP-binding protein [Candidatus Kariarchaeaceae archaeon]
MRKDAKGRIHFKVVFFGPSLSGKTTAFRYLHEQVDGLVKGGITSIEDNSGRTIYFDFSPFSATSTVILDVYTVAGQKRHHNQRKMILNGVDGLLFIADSRPEMMLDNIESATELREFVGSAINNEIPLVIALNKRDVDNPVNRDEMLKSLAFSSEIPYYETVATKGIGVKRAFQSLVREIIMKQLYSTGSVIPKA